jgi:hypothetical protein
MRAAASWWRTLEAERRDEAARLRALAETEPQRLRAQAHKAEDAAERGA